MVTILGGLAEFEREADPATNRRGPRPGDKFGRKPKLSHYQRQEAKARRDNGESFKDIAASYNIHHTAIRRLCRLEVAA
jgi:DNA invertase Pin-like site-specific DNA recombinase